MKKILNSSNIKIGRKQYLLLKFHRGEICEKKMFLIWYVIYQKFVKETEAL